MGEVTLDLPSTTLSVEFDPAVVTVDQIQHAVGTVGYPSTVV